MSLDATRLKNAIIAAMEASPLFSDDMATNAPLMIEFAQIVATETIKEFTDNAELRVSTNPAMNAAFTLGVPVPTDGGAALQTAWIAGTTPPVGGFADGKKLDGSGGIN